MEKIQLKFEFENSLRRIIISPDESFAGLKSRISSLLNERDINIQYKDEENDMILMCRDDELREMIDNADDKRPIRLFISKSENKHEQNTLQVVPPVRTEFPYEKPAEVLRNPRLVERIQALFISPIITEGINQAAQAYVESRGNVSVIKEKLLQQLPLFSALLEELSDEIPALKLIYKKWENLVKISHEDEEEARCSRRQLHFNVSCDGCQVYPDLRQASIQAGHMARRGFIHGLRYKSQTIQNFDLCETCKGSSRFPDDVYGPFICIEAAPRGKRGGAKRHLQREQFLKIKWQKQLSQLDALGFSYCIQYLRILEEENGDLDRVINRIVSCE